MTQKTKFTPIIDTREQKPFEFVESSHYDSPLITKLDSGDYSILGLENKLFIERKANVAELAVNLTQRRWTDELNRVQDYKWKYLICEFDYEHVYMFPQGTTIPKWKQKYVRTTPAFIMACINSLQIQRNIHVLMCSNRDLANSVCIDLMKRIHATRIS